MWHPCSLHIPHKGSRGAVVNSAFWWQWQVPMKRHGAASGEGQVGFRKRFFTTGWWAWNRLPRELDMAPSWWSSRSVWTTPTEMWFGFWVALCGPRSWTPRFLWVPSNLGNSMILGLFGLLTRFLVPGLSLPLQSTADFLQPLYSLSTKYMQWLECLRESKIMLDANI